MDRSGATHPDGLANGADPLMVESSPPEPAIVKVTFTVFAKTVLGEHIHLTGSLTELTNWQTHSAQALDCVQSYPMWRITVDLPASTTFMYKYIRKYNGPPDPISWISYTLGIARPPHLAWESDPARSFTTPSSGSCTISDVWR